MYQSVRIVQKAGQHDQIRFVITRTVPQSKIDDEVSSLVQQLRSFSGAGAMSALLNTVSGGLAAVGGGFLLYATMVGMFGENFLNGVPGVPSPLGDPLSPPGVHGGPIAGFPGVLADAPDQHLDKGLPGVPGYPPIQKR